MNNPFPSSSNNKRYHTFDYYLKMKYHSKVAKVPLDAGFTCPNRDGSISQGGCIFCSERGSGEFAGNRGEQLLSQFESGKQMMQRKWPESKWIAYFQAFTNTYDSVDKLMLCYEPFLAMKDVVGIAIATRPDCLNSKILDYLETLHRQIDITIELGLQTANDFTAKKINRGYSYQCFLDAVMELNHRKIPTVVHIINGLPGENDEDMMRTIQIVAELPIQGIKFHTLLLLQNTALAKLYEIHPFPLLSQEEYIDLLIRQLECLPPHIVIQRIGSDARKEDLIAPTWVLNKTQLSNRLDQEMKRRNTYQGRCYHGTK